MKSKHNFFQNSECRNGYLHRFNIEEEYPEGVLEVCEICFLRKFFRVMDNQLDNQEYMSWHVRNALPVDHELFLHEFPEHELTPSPYV